MKRRAKPKQNAVRTKKRGGERARSRTHRAPINKPPSDFLDSLIAASAQALDLTLDPAWHDGVKFNLGLILRFGALVDVFPLVDEAEPGPIFHA